MTWVTRIKNNIFNNLVTQNVFVVPNEIRPILVTCFLGNELQDVYKKTFGCVSKSTDEKEKEKKKEDNCKAFCVTCKHKNWFYHCLWRSKQITTSKVEKET